MLLFLGITFGILVVVAIHDLRQNKHAIQRNFPVIGHFRYLLESIGPEIRQYFIEQDNDGKPYDRRIRSYIYQSAKGENNKIGFGTQKDYNKPGQTHIKASMFPPPSSKMPKKTTIVIGTNPNKDVEHSGKYDEYTVKEFERSIIAVSDMSFGALSEEAVRALSSGAKVAGIPMGTGEGGLTPYHLEGVVYRDLTPTQYARQCIGWLVAFVASLFSKRWMRTSPPVKQVGGAQQIVELGPKMFGFQTPDGDLDLPKLIETCKSDQIGAVQIKLAQGAKPGTGGVLPAAKITPEIAAIRNVPMGEDCVSPGSWKQFNTVPEMMDFILKIRKAIRKPVGFKFVVAGPHDDFIKQVAQYMKETGNGPDFIVVDGGEGGTGAAPLTLADHVGAPIRHAIPIVDNALREAGVRARVKLISSGKVAEPADIFVHLCLGADAVNIGRGFLFALGCIQALKCHTNMCPTGITTQNKWLRRGLDPREKYVRVANYAKELQRELLMIMQSAGVQSTSELNRSYISMVVSEGVEKSFEDLYPYPNTSTGKRTLPDTIDEPRAQS